MEIEQQARREDVIAESCVALCIPAQSRAQREGIAGLPGVNEIGGIRVTTDVEIAREIEG
jgi:putative protein kinase ArgK-like GTPase of G3E family